MQYDYSIRTPTGVVPVKGIGYAPEAYARMLPSDWSILSYAAISNGPAPSRTTTVQTTTPTTTNAQESGSFVTLGVIALGLWAVSEWF